MSLNHREIDLILSELELEGSWIQKIRQPDFHSLLLDVYKPEKSFPLYISLAPGKVRIHKLTLSIDNPKTLQRFAQFLRARIGSGKIIKAQQIGTDICMNSQNLILQNLSEHFVQISIFM